MNALIVSKGKGRVAAVVNTAMQLCEEAGVYDVQDRLTEVPRGTVYLWHLNRHGCAPWSSLRLDRGTHAGTLPQVASMGTNGGNYTLTLLQVHTTNPCRVRDYSINSEMAWRTDALYWHSRLLRARRKGYDSLWYVNRHEGLPEHNYRGHSDTGYLNVGAGFSALLFDSRVVRVLATAQVWCKA